MRCYVVISYWMCRRRLNWVYWLTELRRCRSFWGKVYYQGVRQPAGPRGAPEQNRSPSYESLLLPPSTTRYLGTGTHAKENPMPAGNGLYRTAGSISALQLGTRTDCVFVRGLGLPTLVFRRGGASIMSNLLTSNTS